MFHEMFSIKMFRKMFYTNVFIKIFFAALLEALVQCRAMLIVFS